MVLGIEPERGGGGGGIVQKIRWADFLPSILQIWGIEARQEGFILTDSVASPDLHLLLH
jgi:hypothetical protein